MWEVQVVDVSTMVVYFITQLVLFSLIQSTVSGNITILSESVYDDADINCSSKESSTLLPLRILQDNITNVIELLQINDTAWIGGEKYILGCINKTEDDPDRTCSDIKHEKLPETFQLNYTCVNTNEAVVFSPKDVTNFKNASNECMSNSGLLPEISMSYPLYKIPDEAKDPDKGSQWYRSVSTKILKDSLVRRCQFLTKIDECSLRVEYDNCESTERQAICFSEENIQFQSSLTFTKFQERGVNLTSTINIISEDSFCLEDLTTTYVEESTAFVTKTSTFDSKHTTDEEKSTDHRTESTQQTTTNDNTETTKLSATGLSTVTELVPVPPIGTTASASNNLWVIAVVLITLLFVLIVILLLWRKRRWRSVLMPDSDKGKATGMFNVSAPVSGSLRRFHSSTAMSEGSDPGIEVLGRGRNTFQSVDIQITDLDADDNETAASLQNSIQRISLKSTNDDEICLVDNGKNVEESTSPSLTSSNAAIDEVPTDDNVNLITEEASISQNRSNSVDN